MSLEPTNPAVRRLVEQLVSPRVGVIRSITHQGRPVDEPTPPYLRVATLSHYDFRSTDAKDRIGAGKGLTDDDAIAAAIGESAERYCSSQWDDSRVRFASAADLGADVITPDRLVLYSDEQYSRPDWPYPRWSPESPISWIRGVTHDGDPVDVPASFSFLTHPPPRPADMLAATTSNGLGCGSSPAAARLSALGEVMERDAFLITWMNRLPAPELDLGQCPDVERNIVRRYRRKAVEVRAFVLPTDLPAATVMAIAFGEDTSEPAQVVGLGCHPSPAMALRKALFELCQGRPSETQRFRDNPPEGRLEDYADVVTLDDHSAFASRRDRRHEFDFLDAGRPLVEIGDLDDPAIGTVEGDLERCTDALVRAGHRVAFVDLTLDDVRSVGLHVVRALVTDLQPIHFGTKQERLGSTRLFECPMGWGFGDRVRTAHDLNPCPHPLA